MNSNLFFNHDIKELGMPYMGCKRKLSNRIVSKILNTHRGVKYFYDLFGGGGAISFEALKYPQLKKVVYNELNTGVVELLKKIQKDGVTEEFYQWVDRDTFMKNKDGDEWFSGLCKTVWSFGNRGASYLFGSDIEHLKKLLHHIVVYKCEKSISEIEKKFGLRIDDNTLSGGIHKRRLKVMRIASEYVENNDKRKFDMQQLERIEQLERLQPFANLLEISNKSYDEVLIDTPLDETVIYLDPPYFGTEKYQNDICHKKLMDYIKRSPYLIYVSSYEFDLPISLEVGHLSTLSSSNNSKVVVERLFCNRGC